MARGKADWREPEFEAGTEIVRITFVDKPKFVAYLTIGQARDFSRALQGVLS